MKNLSQILTYVLLVAVAVLFYFQFSGESKPKPTYDAQAIDSLSANLKIATVNYDSLIENYKLVKDLEKDLETRRTELNRTFNEETRKRDKEIKSLAELYKTKIQEFESKSSQMSEFKAKQAMLEIQEMEQKLGELQYSGEQELAVMQQAAAEEISDFNLENSAKIQTAIVEHINQYNQEHNFTLIIANGAGSALLHADARMDITSDILASLNAEYDKTHKKEEKNKK